MAIQTNTKVKEWVDGLQRKGRLFFSLEQAIKENPSHSAFGLRNALARLVTKGSITTVWKGFFVIVPISYSVNGILPPVMYIDNLMQQLQRKYYVGLLNAAAFYGAAHQSPQVFSVFTEMPSLRDSQKKNIKIDFISRRKFPAEELFLSQKTQTGTVKISNVALTAADLIQFEKEIGGLNRACTVLNELVEQLDFSKLPSSFFDVVSISAIQRLGYLLEYELKQLELAEDLYKMSQDAKCDFQYVNLKNRKDTLNCSRDKKWKVIINTQIEIDE